MPRKVSQDRLKLAVRVFMLKLQEIIWYIVHVKLFVNEAAFVDGAKFKKCSLLHANCTFFLGRPANQRLKVPEHVYDLLWRTSYLYKIKSFKSRSLSTQFIHGAVPLLICL